MPRILSPHFIARFFWSTWIIDHSAILRAPLGYCSLLGCNWRTEGCVEISDVKIPAL
jgi:hypothetical protein